MPLVEQYQVPDGQVSEKRIGPGLVQHLDQHQLDGPPGPPAGADRVATIRQPVAVAGHGADHLSRPGERGRERRRESALTARLELELLDPTIHVPDGALPGPSMAPGGDRRQRTRRPWMRERGDDPATLAHRETHVPAEGQRLGTLDDQKVRGAPDLVAGDLQPSRLAAEWQ